MRRARAALMLTLACLVAAPVASQPARPEAPKAKKAAPGKKPEARKKSDKPKQEAPPPPLDAQAPPPDAPRPYDGQLARLAETMGALAFLRELCKADDGDDWRDKMTALLDAEAPSGVRRQRLVGAFNRGFRGFELTYRSCTPNAEAAVARYLAEADRIAGDVAAHYGAQ